jgi:hypothetical protein
LLIAGLLDPEPYCRYGTGSRGLTNSDPGGPEHVIIMTYRMHISCVLAGACNVMRARRFVNAATRYSGRCVEDRKMSARWKNRALKINRELMGRSHELELGFCLVRKM